MSEEEMIEYRRETYVGPDLKGPLCRDCKHAKNFRDGWANCYATNPSGVNLIQVYALGTCALWEKK